MASGNGSGPESVDVTVERGARNSRRLYAAVQIAAPVHIVWGALTDYERLNTFIPGECHLSVNNAFAGMQVQLLQPCPSEQIIYVVTVRD